MDNSDEDEVPQLPRRSPRKKQRTDPFGEDNHEKMEVSTVSVVTPDQVIVGKEDDNELFPSDEEEENKTDVNRVLFSNDDDEDLFPEDNKEQEEQGTQKDGDFRMPPKHSSRYIASKNTCEQNDTVEVVKECNDTFMLRELFPGKVSILKHILECQILYLLTLKIYNLG